MNLCIFEGPGEDPNDPRNWRAGQTPVDGDVVHIAAKLGDCLDCPNIRALSVDIDKAEIGTAE